MHVEIIEEDRQLIVLALAKLSVDRPGWDFALNEIALKMDRRTEAGRAEMYEAFRRMDRDTAWHRVFDGVISDP